MCSFDRGAETVRLELFVNLHAVILDRQCNVLHEYSVMDQRNDWDYSPSEFLIY